MKKLLAIILFFGSFGVAMAQGYPANSYYLILVKSTQEGKYVKCYTAGTQCSNNDCLASSISVVDKCKGYKNEGQCVADSDCMGNSNQFQYFGCNAKCVPPPETPLSVTYSVHCQRPFQSWNEKGKPAWVFIRLKITGGKRPHLINNTISYSNPYVIAKAESFAYELPFTVADSSNPKEVKVMTALIPACVADPISKCETVNGKLFNLLTSKPSKINLNTAFSTCEAEGCRPNVLQSPCIAGKICPPPMFVCRK